MPDKRFIHLHLHSQYSLLDGAIKFDELLGRCKELGMDSVAVTDHGILFGAIEFYTKAIAANTRHTSAFSLPSGLLKARTCPCPVGPLVP